MLQSAVWMVGQGELTPTIRITESLTTLQGTIDVLYVAVLVASMRPLPFASEAERND